MRYFKLIKENNIFGIINDYNFRRFQKKHEMIIFSEISSAEFIEYKGFFYRDNWLNPYPPEIKDKIIINYIIIDEIDQEEYNILNKALQIEESIREEEPIIESEPIIEEESPQEENLESDITLEYIKKVKIAEIERDNKQKLEAGFDISLENGELYHLSITSSGLFDLITMLVGFPQEKSYYLIEKMNQFKQECDNYKNSLIQEVIASENISDVNKIHYYNQQQE